MGSAKNPAWSSITRTGMESKLRIERARSGGVGLMCGGWVDVVE